MVEARSPTDEFRILVATDNHLGFLEKHGERGSDSFIAFEEILQLAHEKQADFILLGGDLFHDNKPSRNCMIECSRLLKKYCFGDKPIAFEYVSDPSQNFPSLRDPMVNFHDGNLNVSMPVFSIHGNHDDISGLGDTAALELLSVSGLINYFGRWTDLKSVTLSPVLLTKGNTKLGLYGLGNIRDERLYRLFASGEVTMLRPKEDTESWFNIFVLHQNRAKHGPKNYIPVEFLDEFLDLVVWGHEHENRINPEWQESRKLYISQPGSSVATSLCEGEARPKAVGLLRVNGKDFLLEPLPLRSVRPMVFRTLRLSECSSLKAGDPKAAEQYVQAYVDDLLEEAKQQITGHPKQPQLPLIRVRVDYSDEATVFQTIRFGQQYTGRVANPEDMLLLRRERPEGIQRCDTDGPLMDAVPQQEEERVEDFVAKYFSQLDQQSGLHVLNERIMARAVKHFVVKADSDIIGRALHHQLGRAVGALRERSLLEFSEESVLEELDRMREERSSRKMEHSAAGDDTTAANGQQPEGIDSEEDAWEMEAAAGVGAARPKPAPSDDLSGLDSEDDDAVMIVDPEPLPARGRGRGRARGGRGRGDTKAAAPRGRAAPAKKANVSISDFCRPAAASTQRSPASQRSSAASQRPSAASQRPTASQRQASARPVRAGRRTGVVFDSDSDSD